MLGKNPFIKVPGNVKIPFKGGVGTGVLCLRCLPPLCPIPGNPPRICLWLEGKIGLLIIFFIANNIPIGLQKLNSLTMQSTAIEIMFWIFCIIIGSRRFILDVGDRISIEVSTAAK